MNVDATGKNRSEFLAYLKLIVVFFVLLVLAGCSPASPRPAELPTPIPTETQETPRTAVSKPPSVAEIPAGWTTYTNEGCAYEVSYPAEMQAAPQGPYSLILGFRPGQPDDPVPYFIYLSVVDSEIEKLVAAGTYEYEVYNYDPAEVENLLNLQVGESAAVREIANVASEFTFNRQPDRQISGLAAPTFENQQPWGFPSGTKEVRSVLSLNACTYLIGAYLDTSQSNLPGAIPEALFQQILSTIRVSP